MKCAFPTKAAAYFAAARYKYKFTDAEYAAAASRKAMSAPTILQMCEWLGISESGFREWQGNPGWATAKRREEIMLYAKKTFDDSDGAYDCQRVRAQLRWGIERGDKLVRVLMRDLSPVPWPGETPPLADRAGGVGPGTGPRRARFHRGKAPARKW